MTEQGTAGYSDHTTSWLRRITPLWPLFAVIGVLFCVETALEYRHYKRCYDTPIFGQKNCASPVTQNNVNQDSDKQVNEQNIQRPARLHGPTPEWPYRSLLPRRQLRGVPHTAEFNEEFDGLLIWIASASHAEHARLPAKAVFPNLICEQMDQSAEQCLVVNGSKAGHTTDRNLDALNAAGFAKQVDVAILYQMAMFMAKAQNVHDRQRNAAIDSGPASINFKQRMINDLTRLAQRSSLYSHLSEYIGSSIKLAGFRDQNIPDANTLWVQQLDKFLAACRRYGIQAVLTTFAAAYDVDNISIAPRSLLRTLVRENTTLSPEGYVNTVELLNKQTLEFAQQHQLPVIDLAATVGGKPELFVDMVHFNRQGHKMVAAGLAEFLRQRDQ